MSDIEEMCRAHFNEPIISFGEIGRLVGYGETAVDCYLLVRRMRPSHSLLHWNTAVGGYTFLDRLREQNHVTAHNGEDWDDFTRLDNELALNGAPREDEFIRDIRHDDLEYYSDKVND